MSPIREENRKRYPSDWRAIGARIRERAGNRCERCGVPNYAVGYRQRDGSFVPVPGTSPNTYSAARRIAAASNKKRARGSDDRQWIVIILTVAHVYNHDPADCRDENLQALCQRCHNSLDAKARHEGIRQRAREKRNKLSK
jgi:hypothetical protein